MKLLHVISSLKIGGSENLLVNHVQQMQNRKFALENYVCVLGSRKFAADDYLDRLSVPTRFLNLPSDYRNPESMLSYVRAIRSVIKEVQPDIIHSYLWTSDVFTSLASVGLRVGRVAHVLDRRGNRNADRSVERWKTRLTGLLL